MGVHDDETVCLSCKRWERRFEALWVQFRDLRDEYREAVRRWSAERARFARIIRMLREKADRDV